MNIILNKIKEITSDVLRRRAEKEPVDLATETKLLALKVEEAKTLEQVLTQVDKYMGPDHDIKNYLYERILRSLTS